MKIAQELYEGMDIGEGKPVGLITYMRTDSTAISPEAQAAARQMIAETLGASICRNPRRSTRPRSRMRRKRTRPSARPTCLAIRTNSSRTYRRGSSNCTI